MFASDGEYIVVMCPCYNLDLLGVMSIYMYKHHVQGHSIIKQTTQLIKPLQSQHTTIHVNIA